MIMKAKQQPKRYTGSGGYTLKLDDRKIGGKQWYDFYLLANSAKGPRKGMFPWLQLAKDWDQVSLFLLSLS